MGMYTELLLKIEIDKEAVPENIIEILRFLFNNGELPNVTPDHEFFSCSRWKMIGSCSSYYHHPSAVNSWSDEHFCSDIHILSRSDLKNYGSEIELFLDWINQFLSNFTGDCIGWKWYEEDSEPTLIYKR